MEAFEETQYSPGGHRCEGCGFPKMAVIRSNKSVQDGFIPGFQRNIRRHCSTYGEYKKALKEMGLVEIGYDELPEVENKTKYWDAPMLKKLHDMGAGFGDRELDAMERGEIDGLH